MAIGQDLKLLSQLFLHASLWTSLFKMHWININNVFLMVEGTDKNINKLCDKFSDKNDIKVWFANTLRIIN